ncbi:MAG: hypothetical protein JWM53_5367 [bacterium]|nr:hypothetical protein [bacterium]
MRLVLLSWATLALSACAREFHEFDVDQPTRVANEMPPPAHAPGYSHTPYAGKPKYLAEARPLQATTSRKPPASENPCARRTRTCEDRLRAVLASLDGQILALSTPPTELQVSALRLQVEQLAPLLAAYPDVTSEGDELAATVDKLPSLSAIDAGTARRRLTELSDLIRVQLAAAQ